MVSRCAKAYCQDVKHAASTALMQITKGGFNHQEAEGKRSV
jgi:hypothetical protein